MADFTVATTDGLRVELAPATVTVAADQPIVVTVRVVNRTNVIETVDLRVVGVPVEEVTVEPPAARLFPQEVVEMTVTAVPTGRLTAGRHEAAVVVTGMSGTIDPVHAVLAVDVEPVEDLELVAEPPLRTGGRRAVFALAVHNTGNTTLTAQLRARDADQVMQLHVDQPVLQLSPGSTTLVDLLARGPRPWFSNTVERLITVDLTSGDLLRSADVRFAQKPRLTAGLLTILTLGLIGALWAAAMLFGVTSALAPPEPTKVLPASFSSLEGGIGLEDLDPSYVGGAVSGTVTAVSTGRPVSRITVEAFDTQGRLVGAIASDDDGIFAFESLLPTRYRLRVRADGFEPQWWPGADSPAGAELLTVSPTAPVEGLAIEVAGLPASIGGEVIVGTEGTVVTVTVTALDVVDEEGEPLPPVTTTLGEDGTWQVTDLPAPATYLVRLEAEGYDPVDITQPVDAAAVLALNTVRLPSAPGSVAGRVVDLAGNPLGGVEVELQSGDLVVTTTTPTAGEVGAFSFPDLETPDTYLITVRGEDGGAETIAVRLGPGESVTDLEVPLASSTGAITGRVVDQDGRPLGGVTVTVQGGDTSLTTETFTSGQVGTYRVADVPVPGTYAVTFELDGRRPQTASVTISASTPTATLDVTLPLAVGSLTGVVVDDATGAPLPGVEVQVSDGDRVVVATTASDPAAERGRFVLTGLEPGSYTVSVVVDGVRTTLLRRVAAGSTTDVTVRARGAS